MAKVTDLQEFRDRKAGTDFLTDILTDPTKRRIAVGVVAGAAATAAVMGALAQPETRVLSTTGSEVQSNQIVSVTAKNQLAQAIADAADKAPADKLKVLQNGNNLVTVQKAIVGNDGMPLSNPNAVDAATKQYEPVIEITNTTTRLDSMFTPDKIGELGVQALPVDPATGQPAQR